MKLRYGDELYPYCKRECALRRDNQCPGLRIKDDKMFNVIQNDPVLNKIVGADHATHPPCSYYIKNRDKVMDADGIVKQIDILQIRKKKSVKPKPKRCRCKK